MDEDEDEYTEEDDALSLAIYDAGEQLVKVIEEARDRIIGDLSQDLADQFRDQLMKLNPEADDAEQVAWENLWDYVISTEVERSGRTVFDTENF